jgi:hypothetical protein
VFAHNWCCDRRYWDRQDTRFVQTLFFPLSGATQDREIATAMSASKSWPTLAFCRKGFSMIYEFNQATSKMDEFKAEAQVLIPVLQAARAELGEERANRLILSALRAWCRERFKQAGARTPGTLREKWDTLKKLDGERTRSTDLEFEIIKWEPEAIEYNVSRCVYADFFRELGEPELGTVLVCDADVYLVEQVTSPEVEYTRTQSIMQGASFCDIRWRIKTHSIPKAESTLP